jgi:hypothetical protein
MAGNRKLLGRPSGSRSGGTVGSVTPINSVTIEQLIALLEKMQYPNTITVGDAVSADKMVKRLAKVLQTLT